jgi:putative DNA primase/helicase
VEGEYTRKHKLPRGAKWVREENYLYQDEGRRDVFVVRRDHAYHADKRPVINDTTGKQVKRCTQGWFGTPGNEKPPGARRLIFKLPDVIEEIRAGKTIYIVEGENKVQLLRKWGLCATCAPEGALKWYPEHGELLRGAQRVVILPDNDDIGRLHADMVGRSLESLAGTQRFLLELPDLPEHGDVLDWAKAGGTTEQFAELAAQATEWHAYKPPRASKAVAVLVCAADIVPRAKEWLWDGHLLRGAQELLTGIPGLGKSQLQCSYVAHITTGKPWPDGSPGLGTPASVIMVTAEDALDQEVIPRLIAAGANLQKVHILRYIKTDKKQRQFLISEDLVDRI